MTECLFTRKVGKGQCLSAFLELRFILSFFLFFSVVRAKDTIVDIHVT